MVERQLARKIKIFQSDVNGEFSNKEFLDHLTDCGIIRQVSCLRTPEQNSVSKRKHRHVVELGLAMMYHAAIPKYFWVEAFSTSIFLINCHPSPILNMECLFTILFQRNSSYSSLRVFGSHCFPYLCNYVTIKLEPRSLPCIFLGYSDKHKGYYCLHPSSGVFTYHDMWCSTKPYVVLLNPPKILILGI